MSEAEDGRLYGLMEVAEGQQAAVRAAVAEGLAGAATEGAAAVQAATGPLLSRLGSVAEQARQADAALRRVVAWASWRLLGWMTAAVVALVLLGWLASTLVLWWDTGAIAAARAEKRQLQMEVAELRASRDEWVKTGALAKLTRCNPGNRPCVRACGRARRAVRERGPCRLPGDPGLLAAVCTKLQVCAYLGQRSERPGNAGRSKAGIRGV